MRFGLLGLGLSSLSSTVDGERTVEETTPALITSVQEGVTPINVVVGLESRVVKKRCIVLSGSRCSTSLPDYQPSKA